MSPGATEIEKKIGKKIAACEDAYLLFFFAAQRP